MPTILVTGSDTGVGKTHVVAALVRALSSGNVGRGVSKRLSPSNDPTSPLAASSTTAGSGVPALPPAESSNCLRGIDADTVSSQRVGRGLRSAPLRDAVVDDSIRCSVTVQIVKVVETGRTPGTEGDAERAHRLASSRVAEVADLGPTLLAARKPSGEGGSLSLQSYTLASFAAPLAPAAAAALENKTLSCEALVAALRNLPSCDWRIVEGAGGIATPIDAASRDWVDFGIAASVDAIVVVVPDRLGAINQARLAYAHATQSGIDAGVWLNATAPVEAAIAESTRAGLAAAGVPIWGELAFGAVAASDETVIPQKLSRGVPQGFGETSDPLPHSQSTRAGFGAGGARCTDRAGSTTKQQKSDGDIGLHLEAASDTDKVPVLPSSPLLERCRTALAERERQNLRRMLRVTAPAADILNLADNDYLGLANDPALVAAVGAAAAQYGTSASASPLITGWRESHERLVQRLADWHGFACGMLWSSGYAANSAVLGGLPARDDLVFADRLIHASMIAGLLRSGARLQRYEHLNLDRLEALLEANRNSELKTQNSELKTQNPDPKRQTPDPKSRTVFVVTESLFSMDGDYPDLARMAELKRRFGFFWVVDEAHALGWYGPDGSGLLRAAAVTADVDVLVGTFGKTLASGGAYTLFRDAAVRDYLVNTAGEFIYSTSLPPTNVAAAAAALDRLGALAVEQKAWHAMSRNFRAALRQAGWTTPDGDSPIVPIQLDDAGAAVSAADALRNAGILVGAVRPPTVPAGTSRLRLSLKRTFGSVEAERVLNTLEAWRRSR